MIDAAASERELRERIAMHGKSLFDRGYTCGSSGNISVKLPDGMLVTPTNSCLGRLDPDAISKLDFSGNLLLGDKPSKEAFLHLAYYRSRSTESAVVHLHSTWSVAASCLADVDPENVLPAITAYYVMKIGKLPLIPYFAPGDGTLAEAVEEKTRFAKAVLLANHGSVVGAKDLDSAVYATEELEETARLFFALRHSSTRFLNLEQQHELQLKFPS